MANTTPGEARSSAGQVSPENAPVISPLHAWFTVALLFALFLVSFLDRTILALVTAPVAASLALSDYQMALLLGAGFAFVYAAAGILLGQLIDTKSRRIVVTAGVVLWSMSTIASSLASGFYSLLLLRCGVAVGEAVLTPAAVSLIADMFQRDRRALPLSIYMSVASVGSIATYILGAAAIDLAALLAAAAGYDIWRWTFMIVGLPGLVLSGIFYCWAADPARGDSRHIGKDAASMKAYLRYLGRNAGFYGPMICASAAYAVWGLATLSWMPTMLTRSYGLDQATAGYRFGMVGVPMGLLGTFLWPWLAIRADRWLPDRGVPLVLLITGLLMGPAAIYGAIAPDADSAILLTGCAIMFGAAFPVLLPLLFQMRGPGHMRARLAATNLLAISVLGYGVGPIAAVHLGELFGQGDGALGHGLSALAVAVWPTCLICAGIGMLRARTLVQPD